VLFRSGVIPILLVLGGALAIYLGIEEVKTSAPAKEEPTAQVETEKKS
jgi:hypothetical protein